MRTFDHRGRTVKFSHPAQASTPELEEVLWGQQEVEGGTYHYTTIQLDGIQIFFSPSFSATPSAAHKHARAERRPMLEDWSELGPLLEPA